MNEETQLDHHLIGKTPCEMIKFSKLFFKLRNLFIDYIVWMLRSNKNVYASPTSHMFFSFDANIDNH